MWTKNPTAKKKGSTYLFHYLYGFCGDHAICLFIVISSAASQLSAAEIFLWFCIKNQVLFGGISTLRVDHTHPRRGSSRPLVPIDAGSL